ncbi:MAG: sigma-54-dependent Fis family transcriptional regulator, partial [Planctomycetaceae bacterium]
MVPPETIRALQSHSWPGNIRELANVLEHALILSDGQVLLPSDLPRTLRKASVEDGERAGMPTVAGTVTAAPAAPAPLKTLRQMEE